MPGAFSVWACHLVVSIPWPRTRKGTPSLSTTKISDKIALRVVQNAYVTLEDVRIPESSRLQRAESFRQTAALLRLTRTGVA